MKLRKKILAFDGGMNVYSNLLEDEEDILIPFAISLYVTNVKIRDLLHEYIDDLNKNECREMLGIDFDQMTQMEYWMKNGKLKRDMKAMSKKAMKDYGIEFTIKGLKLETTQNLYDAIEKGTIEMIEMLKEVQQKLDDAPFTLFGNFYRYQKSLCDRYMVETRYKHFKRDLGVLSSDTYDLLIDKQMFEMVKFLEKKFLRLTLTPSQRISNKVNLDMIYDYLPDDYVLPDGFEKCYARLMRFASWEKDILKIDQDKFGNYLFLYFYELNDEERQALYEFDIMLELIHQDMMKVLPDVSKIAPMTNEPEKNAVLLSPVEECIRECIDQLMKEQYGNEELFNRQGHWQAVYRILVDKEYCKDSDFDGFDSFIRRVMPEKVNKPYKKDSVKSISQTDYSKTFNKWHYDPQISSTRKPYDRMVAVAKRFLELLEEKGL